MKILVEGWRNINHSYSIVNQSQILNFLKDKNVKIFFKDINFFNSNWSEIKNSSGFKREDMEIINSLPAPNENDFFDVTYRISFPYNFDEKFNSKILVVFGTSEYQDIKGFYENGCLSQIKQNKNFYIHTPSQWSEKGFLNEGFLQNQVKVISHGIDYSVFKPLSNSEFLKYRKQFNFSEDDIILLSLGAMTPNKGIDILVNAFYILKKKYKSLKLVLKDQSNLYGIKPLKLINDIINSDRNFSEEKKLQSKDIIVVSDNLNLDQLKLLYGVSNCYISPYRAEGFNLPPLEAVSSGTPIIITKGGSTDDYFKDTMGYQIESDLRHDKTKVFLEPRLESLVEQIENIITKKKEFNHNVNHDFIKKNYNWKKISDDLLSFFKSKI